MKAYLETFRRYRFLLEDLISRDLKVKYRRSVLGFLWSILNPLLMMLVITAVFQNLFRWGDDMPYFPIYYLTGWLIFNFVMEATSAAMVSIISAAPLIKKVYVPKYIFPLEKILFSFVNMLFSLVAVAIVVAVLQMPIHWTVLLFPIPMIFALLFSIGLGFILAAFNVFFRDIGHLYSVWTTAWMYLTPVIYPDSMIVKMPAFVQAVIRCNPLYYYVDYFRQVVMYGTVPGWKETLLCIAISLVVFALGLFVFKRKQDRFILFI